MSVTQQIKSKADGIKTLNIKKEVQLTMDLE